MEQKSKCCNAPLHAVTSDEGTGYYMCTKCKNPTDPMTLPEDVREQQPENTILLNDIALLGMVTPKHRAILKELLTSARKLAYQQGKRAAENRLMRSVNEAKDQVIAAKAAGYQEGVKAMQEAVKKAPVPDDLEVRSIEAEYPDVASVIDECADQLLNPQGEEPK